MNYYLEVTFCLMVNLSCFKDSVDKGNEYGANLTEMSKEFDCTDHRLLIAKLF